MNCGPFCCPLQSGQCACPVVAETLLCESRIKLDTQPDGWVRVRTDVQNTARMPLLPSEKFHRRVHSTRLSRHRSSVGFHRIVKRRDDAIRFSSTGGRPFFGRISREAASRACREGVTMHVTTMLHHAKQWEKQGHGSARRSLTCIRHIG